MAFQSFHVEGWGDFKIARIIPTLEDGSWGHFTPLVGTEYERLIETITIDEMEMAINGHPKPLLERGLRSAKGCLKVAPVPRLCGEIGDCASAERSRCTIESKKTLPECFNPVVDEDCIRFIISAWVDGYTVVREE